MTQEEKQLLLKDLSARLPYGVKIYTKENGKDTSFVLTISDLNWIFDKDRIDAMYDYDGWKPYLRPMSSMTEEEREEFRVLGGVMSYSPQHNTWAISAFSPEAYDWLLANHFDFRGLIPMGLALEAKEGMYKTE